MRADNLSKEVAKEMNSKKQKEVYGVNKEEHTRVERDGNTGNQRMTGRNQDQQINRQYNGQMSKLQICKFCDKSNANGQCPARGKSARTVGD
jgi:hypothetical protein